VKTQIFVSSKGQRPQKALLGPLAARCQFGIGWNSRSSSSTGSGGTEHSTAGGCLLAPYDMTDRVYRPQHDTTYENWKLMSDSLSPVISTIPTAAPLNSCHHSARPHGLGECRTVLAGISRVGSIQNQQVHGLSKVHVDVTNVVARVCCICQKFPQNYLKSDGLLYASFEAQ
jgi:hypothetical protein